MDRLIANYDYNNTEEFATKNKDLLPSIKVECSEAEKKSIDLFVAKLLDYATESSEKHEAYSDMFDVHIYQMGRMCIDFLKYHVQVKEDEPAKDDDKEENPSPSKKQKL